MTADTVTRSHTSRGGLWVKLTEWLSEPRLKGIDLDSNELLLIQREILTEKTMFKEVCKELYDICIRLDRQYFRGDQKRVEIGSGVSLFKHFYPEVISTDVKSAPHLDQVVDAQNMPFDAGSIRGIYAISTFHHCSNPHRFFDELERVLVPGGGCVIIEPYYGFMAEKTFQRTFDSEYFDKNQRTWESSREMTFMKEANQALSYIVFVRDRVKFEKMHSNLEIMHQETLPNYLRYILSGGLNFKQILPNVTIPLLRFFEGILRPLERWTALHHVIVLRKRSA